jgi:serine protease
VADVAARPQADGIHTFTLSGVPAGTYQIFSGSDSNNNLLICDAGESCGAYLTLDSPILVDVDRDLSGLEFASGLTVNLAEFQRADADEREPVETGLRRGSSRRQIGAGP